MGVAFLTEGSATHWMNLLIALIHATQQQRQRQSGQQTQVLCGLTKQRGNQSTQQRQQQQYVLQTWVSGVCTVCLQWAATCSAGVADLADGGSFDLRLYHF